MCITHLVPTPRCNLHGVCELARVPAHAVQLNCHANTCFILSKSLNPYSTLPLGFWEHRGQCVSATCTFEMMQEFSPYHFQIENLILWFYRCLPFLTFCGFPLSPENSAIFSLSSFLFDWFSLHHASLPLPFSQALNFSLLIITLVSTVIDSATLNCYKKSHLQKTRTYAHILKVSELK